jgi:hypothetical protein
MNTKNWRNEEENAVTYLKTVPCTFISLSKRLSNSEKEVIVKEMSFLYLRIKPEGV